MKKPPFSVCVYCGSRDGALPGYGDAARRVGEEIGRRGWQLVFGGGKVGLMGQVADATLRAGGTVVGVIPRTLMEREVGHPSLSELHVVETMHERKQLMAQRADAFVALPGGIGTLEELYEVWTWRQLGYHDKPIGLLNVEGYYDGLLEFMAGSVRQGFLSADQLAALECAQDPKTLLDRMRALASSTRLGEDYGRI